MLISDLIKILEQLKAEHGDVVVCHHDDWDNFEVEGVEFDPASDSYPKGDLLRIDKGQDGWSPDMVIIHSGEF